MTRLIIETDDKWTREKIRCAIDTEIYLLKKACDKTQEKIKSFVSKYGELNRDNLYGKIDDIELIEWEGECETLERIHKKLKSLEEIVFEYR